MNLVIFSVLSIILFQLVSSSRDTIPDDPGSEKRILNGKSATRGQFPFMAAISYRKRDHKWYLCSGSIIHPRWVLTAAHCVLYPLNCWSIHMGSIYATNREGGDALIESTEAYSYASYTDPDTQYYDIGLIHLPQSITFTNYLKPIHLPRARDIKEDITGKNLYIAGWGATQNHARSIEELRYTTITVYKPSRCAELYNMSILVFCALGPNHQSACHGDSGGPVFRIVNGKPNIVGVVSKGRKNHCEMPTIHSHVVNYMPWIFNVTGIVQLP